MKKCIECEQVFSNELSACPNCGCPVDLCGDADLASPPNASPLPVNDNRPYQRADVFKCRWCGNMVSGRDRFCQRCGTPIYESKSQNDSYFDDVPYSQQQHHPQPQYARQPMNKFDVIGMPMPSTHLVAAILITIFLCFPFGLVACIYASKVSSSYHSGDYQGSVKASNKAASWIKVSVISWLIFIAIVIMYLLCVLYIVYCKN